MAVADVLAALQTLAPTALASSVAKLGAEIIRQLVTPALVSEPARSFTTRTDGGAHVVELVADGASPSALRTLVVLLDFLAAHLLAASPILAAALPPILAPAIQALTIEHALTPALPDTLSTTALAIFQTRLDDALALEAAMERSGLLGEGGERTIRRWVERAGEHWAERRAQVASKALRSLIVRMDWEAVVVDWREPSKRCVTLRALAVALLGASDARARLAYTRCAQLSERRLAAVQSASAELRCAEFERHSLLSQSYRGAAELRCHRICQLTLSQTRFAIPAGD